MTLMPISVLIASCKPIPGCQPLDQTTRETLTLVKMEILDVIKLTNEKEKKSEVDAQVGNDIIDSLTATVKQIDSLIPVSIHLGKQGTKYEILNFAEQTNVLIQNSLINLLSLRHLYDISTYSQFETATFFPADSGSIPAGKINEAKEAMEPIARRIILFLNDHPHEKFQTVIAYSATSADKEMNDTLCKLRGLVVANLLLDQIKSNEAFIPRPEWIHYNTKWMIKWKELPPPTSGKGKQKHHKPEPTPAPKPESKHRNMVSLTWNIVPVSLYAGSSNR
ncbi:hypothetical protein SAMN05660816_00969 [Niastella yeongjuensis]|nr:hypothetical protein SAMN05660816_00969 [Niastella yeongjuensis]